MNHLKVYNSIINNAKTKNRIKGNIYYEKHHIIPKCLGGEDIEDNLILLTAREHYICHKLLTYIYPNNRNIALAFHYMTGGQTGNILNLCSRDFEYAKELNGKFIWNRGLTKETDARVRKQGKIWKEKYDKGEIVINRVRLKETREKMSRSKKGISKTKDHKNKISDSLLGRKLSESTKQKMSESRKGIPQKKLMCPYCRKEGGTTMYRWHFNNCKFKNI